MKIKVLANDGISDSGVSLLESKSYEVITENVPQDNLIEYINNNNVSCLLVRSATKVRSSPGSRLHGVYQTFIAAFPSGGHE